MPGVVVVGAQWGDEGKGKIVDLLAERFDVVARYQGGANAGHTVVVGEETYKFHLLPSGILDPGKLCVLGNGCVIDPEVLCRELDELEARGKTSSGLRISANAHLVMPWHRLLDAQSEVRLGELQIGTTRRGIGPAYADKVSRLGIRVQDLLDEGILRQKIGAALAVKRGQLGPEGDALDEDAIAAATLRFAERLAPHICDASLLLERTLDAGRGVLFEGAQGTLLDIDNGTYPFVTSSSPTAGGAATGTGVGPTRIDAVMGVAKAYLTRVGAGPFPSEADEERGARIRDIGGEFGTTTGRSRRTGWLDLVGLRYAKRLNGMTELVLTKLDVLSHFASIPVCVAYRLPDGTVTEEFPMHQSDFHHAQPVFEELPGWNEDVSAVTRWDDLPPAARERSVRLRLTDIVLATIDGRARTVAVLREELHRILNDTTDQSEAWRNLAAGFSDMLQAMVYSPFEGPSDDILERSAEVERIARQHFATDETYLGLVHAIRFFLLTRYAAVADARRTLFEYVALCERNHFAPRLPSVSPQRGLLAFLSGDYDSACALLTHKPGQREDRFSEPEPLLVQLSTALLATIYYERNEPEAAWHLINQLLIDADRTFPETWALGVRARVLSLEALGQRDEADRTLLQELHVARARDAGRLTQFLQAIELELRLRRETTYLEAESLAAALTQELARHVGSWIMIEQLARAVVPHLLLTGQLERARSFAERLTARATACGHLTREALGHLLSARLADAVGDDAQVSLHLAAALSRTARTRSIRPYIDLWGKDLTSLVRMLSDPGIAQFSDHLRAVLRALEVLRPEGSPGWNALSERERDVLSALSAHATTKAIAKHLALSPETVKHHLKRIFAKLGVHSREQALKRAAERGG